MQEYKFLKTCNIIVSVVFAVCLSYILSFTFFMQSMQQGFSMAPNINDRSVVLVNRLYRTILSLKRKDIIIFRVKNQYSIKRIYGLPYETVQISGGKLFINNIEQEDIGLSNSLSSNISQNIKLGPNEYYVLGDNLDSSNDSRFADIGNIKREDIIGKVWHINK